MDGDFRRPMVASIFGVVPPRDGFSATFMRGDLPAAVREVPANPNLRLLLPTLGHLSQIDRLDSERVRVAFNAARGAADVVVVDSAPASEVSDALLLAAGADITLVAVRIGYTRYDRFDALRTSLANYGVSPAGLVVTTKTPPSFVVYGSTMPVAIETRAPAQPSQWQRQDRARSRARAARAKR
jgi:Mrp family chromosome partitioning ATPase